MLTSEAMSAWFFRLGLPQEAQTIVETIRSSAPARLVGGGRRNVSGRYPSRKMGVTIQFDSHRVELAFVHELEHDPDVLEYYDQPPSFRLEYRSACGRPVVVTHTADYCVWVRTNLFSRMPATAQSLGLNMFGNTVLMCWFASTLRASWRTLHTADVSPSFGDYALCPKWGSSANGGLSCMVKVRHLRAGCVQHERATARFNRLIRACSAQRVRSK
jgi:hypothetical protein